MAPIIANEGHRPGEGGSPSHCTFGEKSFSIVRPVHVLGGSSCQEILLKDSPLWLPDAFALQRVSRTFPVL
jgi:hypothetical protein